MRFLLLAWAMFLSGCGTTHELMVLQAVGPRPSAVSHGGEGSLEVFSATSEFNDGGIRYYPHTDYRIYTDDGAFVKYVRNHVTQTDQKPERVRLPVGTYCVIARSEGYGVVKVPVVLKGGQYTFVHLNHTPMREAKQATEADLVRLPNGWAVGWRAKPGE